MTSLQPIRSSETKNQQDDLFGDFLVETPFSKTSENSEMSGNLDIDVAINGEFGKAEEMAYAVVSSNSLESDHTLSSPQPVVPLEAELEAITASAIEIESQLDKLGLLDNTTLKQNIEKILHFSETVSQSPHHLFEHNLNQGLKTIRHHITNIIQLMQREQEFDVLLQVVTDSVQQLLRADRVVIYRFDSDTKGTVVAEALTEGWTPSAGEQLDASCFGLKQAQIYQKQNIYAIADVRKIPLTAHQRQLMARFQVKASLCQAILIDNQVWGLLVVQQCQQPRPWQQHEIEVPQQIIRELVIHLQAYRLQNQSQRRAVQEKNLTSITNEILKATDTQSLYTTTVSTIRRVLDTDRVGVFQFYPDSGHDAGEFVAEDVAAGISSALAAKVEDHCFGDRFAPKYAEGFINPISDVYKADLKECHLSILTRFDVRANLVVPLLKGDELWGLLCVHECRGPREWKEDEIDFVSKVGRLFSVARQQAALLAQTQQAAEREKSINQIVERIRKSVTVDEIFDTTTREVRYQLECDRVSVYQFHEDWSGTYVSESVGSDWRPLVGPGIKTVWPDTHLQDTQGGRYANRESFAVRDIYTVGHSDCHVDILKQFQVRAYVIVPIFQGQRLWGLLAAYQNSGTRTWQENEMQLLEQISGQLGVAIQQSEYLAQAQQAAEREKSINQIVERIRKSVTVDEIFDTTTREVRYQLECDRVSVYQFHEDWSGTYVSESVGSDWRPLVGPGIETVWPDTHLQDTQGGRYANRESFAVRDIYTVGHSDCHVDILKQFQVRAYVIVPIFQGQRLWGLLAAYQNSGTRTWQENEMQLLMRVANQLGVALQYSQALNDSQTKALQLQQGIERAQAVNRVVNRVRNTLDLDTIFNTATREVRHLLKVERVTIYKFRSDFYGDFISESVTGNYPSLVGSGWEDPYLNEHQGGRFRDNIPLVVHDIHVGEILWENGHLNSQQAPKPMTDCHVEALEAYQVQACAVVSIFKGKELWGLLSAFQNTGSRVWEEEEINLLMQVALQVGNGIQQAEYANELQAKSEQLAEAAAREKASKESLQQRAVQLLMAVRPALDGDLTVRAPLSEDEMGTVADAYNNTIQSLRRLVVQVKDAAQEVTQTSQGSEIEMRSLSDQTQQGLDEINDALNRIQSMIDSTHLVDASARQVEAAVQQANQTVQDGDQAMNRTVESILVIRETVAETTKKIKRLSESSQKVSKVVSLIDSFTTQTNLLALNASIEATRAGEYGKGFAVVADEVRLLAQQSAEATAEIEKLIQGIQSETSSVSDAMETGIEQVVRGTELVTETRQSLNEIVNATKQISGLVEGITQAAQTQTQQSESVNQIMKRLTETANHTSDRAVQITNSFQHLLQTSQTLQDGIGQFKVN